MNSKLKDASKLVKSRVYILITDKEGTMAGDFRDFDGFMKLSALHSFYANTAKMIDELEHEISEKQKPATKRSVKKPSPTKGKAKKISK